MAVKVTNLKCIEVLPNRKPAGKAEVGRQRWSAELDGLGDAEFELVIPNKVNRLKDGTSKDNKIVALAKEKATRIAEVRAADHA